MRSVKEKSTHGFLNFVCFDFENDIFYQCIVNCIILYGCKILSVFVPALKINLNGRQFNPENKTCSYTTRKWMSE